MSVVLANQSVVIDNGNTSKLMRWPRITCQISVLWGKPYMPLPASQEGANMGWGTEASHDHPEEKQQPKGLAPQAARKETIINTCPFCLVVLALVDGAGRGSRKELVGPGSSLDMEAERVPAQGCWEWGWWESERGDLNYLRWKF